MLIHALESSNDHHVNAADSTATRDAARIAVQAGDSTAAQDERVDPAANDNYVIRLAAQQGHLTVVDRLLQDERAAQDVRVDPAANDDCVIRLAAQQGHLTVVDRLLQDERVDPAANDNYAIRVASEKGHSAAVDRLMRAAARDARAAFQTAAASAAQTAANATKTTIRLQCRENRQLKRFVSQQNIDKQLSNQINIGPLTQSTNNSNIKTNISVVRRPYSFSNSANDNICWLNTSMQAMMVVFDYLPPQQQQFGQDRQAVKSKTLKHLLHDIHRHVDREKERIIHEIRHRLLAHLGVEFVPGSRWQHAPQDVTESLDYMITNCVRSAAITLDLTADNDHDFDSMVRDSNGSVDNNIKQTWGRTPVFLLNRRLTMDKINTNQIDGIFKSKLMAKHRLVGIILMEMIDDTTNHFTFASQEGNCVTQFDDDVQLNYTDFQSLLNRSPQQLVMGVLFRKQEDDDGKENTVSSINNKAVSFQDDSTTPTPTILSLSATTIAATSKRGGTSTSTLISSTPTISSSLTPTSTTIESAEAIDHQQQIPVSKQKRNDSSGRSSSSSSSCSSSSSDAPPVILYVSIFSLS
jgi:hypothetical protein